MFVYIIAFDNFCRVTYGDGIVWNIFSNYASGSNLASFAYMNTCHNYTVRPNMRVFIYYHDLLYQRLFIGIHISIFVSMIETGYEDMLA